RLPDRHQTKMSTPAEITSALHIHSPFLERTLLCVVEKFEDSGSKLLRTFNMWHMAATIDDAKLGTRDLLMKPFTKGQRDKSVFAAPHNEGRFVDRAHSAVQNVFAANH